MLVCRQLVLPAKISLRFLHAVSRLPFVQGSLPIMSAELIPSNPSDVMVIRSVTRNIVTFSVPFARFGKAKIGGRGTLGTFAIPRRAAPRARGI